MAEEDAVDTRCAANDLQLDVDILMLEYAVYKAVECHFDLLAQLCRFENATPKEKTSINQAIENCNRLVNMQKHLHDLFVFHHGQAEYKELEATEFDAVTLEFVVSLTQWLLIRHEICDDTSPEMLRQHEKWRRQSEINAFFRRLWLDSSSGTSAGLQGIRPSDYEAPSLRFHDHLMPTFMKLSCYIHSTQQDVNEKWMNLALSFAFRAGIEDLEDLMDKNIDLDGLERRLDEYFAWGFDRRVLSSLQDAALTEFLAGKFAPNDEDVSSIQKYIESVIELEVDCLRLFSVFPSNQPLQDISAIKEVPEWSKLKATRQGRLRHALSGGGTPSFRETIRELHGGHGLFIEELLRYVEDSFDLVHQQTSGYGKPRLVQIEEGGLDGLDQKAFEQFKMDAYISSISFVDCLKLPNGSEDGSTDEMDLGSPEL